MSPRPLHLLVVDDDDDDYAAVRELLRQAGSFRVERAHSHAEALEKLAQGFDAMLVAHRVGAHTGVELAREAAGLGADAPVVVLAGAGEHELDVEAMRAGAADFLDRSELTPALLERTLRYAVEHGRAEAELRESRRALATLMGNLPGMAYRCRVDPRYTLEFASDGARALTGYAPDELVENRVAAFGELIAPEDRARVWRIVREAVRDMRPFQAEYRIRDRAGDERWVEENGVPIRRPGGRPVLEGFISDVTERRRAEEALRRSGDYFRAITEAVAEIVAVGGPDGSVRFISPGVLALTGYTPEEWLGMNILSTIHPDDLPDAQATFAHLVSTPGSLVHVELRLVHRNGTPHMVEVTARNLLDDPAVRGIVYNTRDITLRKQGEEAVRQRERHFRSLLEHTHDIIAILEGDGDVRFVSPSVERMLGYPRERIQGTYLFELIHPDDVPGVLEVFDRAIRSPGEPRWAEFRILHAGGSWRTLESVCTSLLHDPAVTGIVVNSRDVTDRRTAEEALRLSQQQLLQAQKMDAVGRLAGGVAHDFNNLLTAIRGNAELLLLDIPTGDPRRDDVDEIRKAADRAAALTRQLLAFSRRQVLQPRVLDLNGVVGEMERMLRRLIGEDVELVTRLSSGLAQVRADPGQVEQVVMNLAVNARDAMPAGGKLIVQTANVELTEDLRRSYPFISPGPYVMLCVSDTGQGMDSGTRERAFEPFFTTKPAGRGTGLGLSTVYGIVKQSGGYVWIDSELGQGTEVRIFLPPAADPASAASFTPMAALREKGEGTVLLAEDEVTVRRLAARVLRRGGFEVLEAGDGEDALAVAGRHDGRLDLLVTDIVMPRMGGRELAAKLRETRPGLHVVYVSGYAEEAVQRDGVLDDEGSFLPKPFTAEQLLDAVHAVLRQARASS